MTAAIAGRLDITVSCYVAILFFGIELRNIKFLGSSEMPVDVDSVGA